VAWVSVARKSDGIYPISPLGSGYAAAVAAEGGEFKPDSKAFLTK